MWSDTPISLRISQFVVIHTVKSFSFKETDVFLGLPHFLYGLMNIDNSTSCSSVSLKPSLFIWKFSVHVHQTLLSKWDTSMAKHHYCFGLAASILLELLIIVLFSSPAACLTASNLGGTHLSPSYLFAFSYYLWGSPGKLLKWVAISFSSGPRFVKTLHYDPSVLGGPAWHGS